MLIVMNSFSWPGVTLGSAQQWNCQEIPTSKGVSYNDSYMIDISKLDNRFYEM